MDAVPIRTTQLGQLPETTWAPCSAGQNVAMRATDEPRLRAATETEMMRDDPLAQDVVRVQPDVARLGMPNYGLLAGRKPAQLRHP